jgi:hypothetical protein
MRSWGKWEMLLHPEVQAGRESLIALAGAFDGALLLEDPENVQRGLQEKLGLVLAKVRRDFILPSPAPPRL